MKHGYSVQCNQGLISRSLQEQIAHGERVRDHVVEGLTGGTWVQLAAGKVIGHKWIYRFEPRVVSKLRLNISASLAPPRLRAFAGYHTGGKESP